MGGEPTRVPAAGGVPCDVNQILDRKRKAVQQAGSCWWQRESLNKSSGLFKRD
jgi:hypothetical protein